MNNWVTGTMTFSNFRRGIEKFVCFLVRSEELVVVVAVTRGKVYGGKALLFPGVAHARRVIIKHLDGFTTVQVCRRGCLLG